MKLPITTILFASLSIGCATRVVGPAPRVALTRDYRAARAAVYAATTKALANTEFGVERTEDNVVETKCVNIVQVPALMMVYPHGKKGDARYVDERCRKYIVTIENTGSAKTAVRIRAKTLHVGDDVTTERWNAAVEQTSFDSLFDSINVQLSDTGRVASIKAHDENATRTTDLK